MTTLNITLIKPINKIWFNVKIVNNQEQDLLNHKWILLFVNRKLNPDKKLDHPEIKLNVSKLIKTFSNVMPPAMRYFPNINLSGCNLSGSRLRGANLQGADLEETDLESTDLTQSDYSNLKNANIRFADLSYSSAISANFEQANLHGTNMSVAKMENSNFKYANLKESNLSYIQAKGAIFENSVLSGSNMIKSDFRDTKFNNAVLNSANISNSNFTNSRLEDIDIHEFLFPKIQNFLIEVGPAYLYIFCDNTDFSNAVFNDQELTTYLRDRGAKFD